jgi:hypothetical protein
MRMDTAITRNGSIGVFSGCAHPIGDFTVVCIFSAAGLMLTALGLALVGFEELAQIMAVAG